MSTIPRDQSWRDAGLVDPPLAQLVEAPAEAEEYLPPDPRPDRDGHAAEADVAEQAAEVVHEDDDEYR